MTLGYLKCSCGLAVQVIERDVHCLSCSKMVDRTVAEFAIRRIALERSFVIDRCGIHAGPDGRLIFLFSLADLTEATLALVQ